MTFKEMQSLKIDDRVVIFNLDYGTIINKSRVAVEVRWDDGSKGWIHFNDGKDLHKVEVAS